MLEKENKLLRNYTQNIDTLEHAAGIQNVITCHGKIYSYIETALRNERILVFDIYSKLNSTIR